MAEEERRKKWEGGEARDFESTESRVVHKWSDGKRRIWAAGGLPNYQDLRHKVIAIDAERRMIWIVLVFGSGDDGGSGGSRGRIASHMYLK
ncbi:hypothetical protein CIB48_g11392 [Xylaria polymorpha]|nr:hypothetical protein CIB48_g11392 [Xylaria polymorpha]